MAEDFRTLLNVSSPVWVDTRKVTYRELKFTRGWRAAVFNLGSALHSVRAMSKGNFQGRSQGDVLQNGGVLVLQKGGACVYGFASKEAGDKPPIDEVLAACARATESRKR